MNTNKKIGKKIDKKTAKLYLNFFEDNLRLAPSANDYLNYSKMNYLNKYYENFLSPIYQQKTKKLYQKYDKLLRQKNKGKDENEISIFDKVLKYEINITLEGLKLPLKYMPIDQMNNIITQYMETASGGGLIVFEKMADYKNFMFKTKQFSILCKQIIINMRIGIKKKYILPRVIVEFTIDMIEKAIKDKSWENKTVPESMRKKWDDVMDKYLVKPTTDVLFFLKHTYLPKSTEKIGYSSLPNGRKLYEYLVKYYTTLDDMSIAEIHKIGKSEVKRVNKAMDETRKKYGFKGNLKEFNDYLKTDPKVHFTTEKELMDTYYNMKEHIWTKIVPKLFNIKPTYNYSIKKVPAFMEESAPAAYYWAGDLENKRKGTFYINLRDIKSMARMDVEVLSLHEGNPGHHFQQTIQMESKKIPLFVKSANYDSYVEGWGLYSENLGEYKDALSYYGKLNFEMMRSVRLVVDTGIHYYGWTFQKCKDYFLKYTSLPVSEIDAEIYRYIADPGQALGYKIGELTILKLRKKYLADPKHNIKDFHQIVLENGNIPLKILKDTFSMK